MSVFDKCERYDEGDIQKWRGLYVIVGGKWVGLLRKRWQNEDGVILGFNSKSCRCQMQKMRKNYFETLDEGYLMIQMR